MRRRKNRYPQSASEQYDNLVVPSTDFHSNSVDSLSDNQFYDRDSSYQAVMSAESYYEMRLKLKGVLGPYYWGSI